jgi:hypothetical protein
MNRLHSHRYSLLGLLLGAASLMLLAWKTGPTAVVAALAKVGPAAVLLLIPYTLATMLYAVPWGLLITKAHRPRWIAIVGSRFAAAAVNVVLPSGLFGEPVRLRSVAPDLRGFAGEALVWDRALYMGASAGFIALAALGALGVRDGAAYVAAAGAAVAGYLVAGASLVGITQIGLFRRFFGRHIARRWPVFPSRRRGSSCTSSLG